MCVVDRLKARILKNGQLAAVKLINMEDGKDAVSQISLCPPPQVRIMLMWRTRFRCWTSAST
jgi:hypothetical protein